MKLSVELFRHTVQQLKGANLEEHSEKRSNPRMGLRSRIHLHPIQSGALGEPVEAWTHDISRVGLGVLCASKMRVGEHFLLTLPHEDPDTSDKRLALYCTVRRCREASPGSYSVGFTFEDLRSKVRPAQAPAADLKPAVKPVPEISPNEEERIRKAILS